MLQNGDSINNIETLESHSYESSCVLSAERFLFNSVYR